MEKSFVALGTVLSIIGTIVGIVASIIPDVFISIDKKTDVSPAAITQVFIQNETISTNTNFDADITTLGSNVTTLKPSGDIIISGCTVNMTASEYVLQPTFSISSNSTISLTIKIYWCKHIFYTIDYV